KPTPLHAHQKWRRSSLLLFVFLTSVVSAQEKIPANLGSIVEARKLRQNAKSVVESDLQILSARSEQARGVAVSAMTNAAELGSFSFNRVMLRGAENVGIRIRCESSANILYELKKLGMEVTGTMESVGLIEGFLPISRIDDLDGLRAKGLLNAAPITPAVTHSGNVFDQADHIEEAWRVRAAQPTGYDGSGVRVGIVSDSFNALGGADAGVAAGEIPNVTVLADTTATGVGDEGRAMAELIHDLAPGSPISFATGFDGEIACANRIRALATDAQPARIIVDDLAYLSEPFFQDGIIANAVRDVVTANNVSYFVAAGNAGSLNYTASADDVNFGEATIGGLASSYLDFDKTDAEDFMQRISIPSHAYAIIDLQWDDSWFNNGVDTDLDIYLLDTGGNVLQAGQLDNIAMQAPYEYLYYGNPAATAIQCDLVIRKSSGPNPKWVKWIGVQNTFTIAEHAGGGGTIFGHAMSAQAITVGAVPYSNQLKASPFTSAGPATVLFSSEGDQLATAEMRSKPDIAAVQGVDNSFFGSDNDGNGLPNFTGTSAAAPHAAAVAALLLQANPDFSPADLADRLRATARAEAGQPGFDNLTGAGSVSAFRAVFPESPVALMEFNDDFSSGALSPYYQTRSDGAGRIVVRNGVPAAGDGYSVVMDTASNYVSSPFSLNEMTMSVNCEGKSNVTLSFREAELGDEDHMMPESFTGHSMSDGVAFSVDGTNWHRLVSLTGPNSTSTFQTKSFSLSDLAAGLGLTLGDNLQIRFQQYDNYNVDTTSPSLSDGIAFDDIRVFASSATPTPSPTPTPVPTPTEEEQLILQLVGVATASSADRNGDGTVDAADLIATVR
ncbi:MAG: S8 family serine peptidase, partial [Candidatus Sumerlaeota bacterium]